METQNDGPLFRAIIKALEVRSQNLKKSVKNLSSSINNSISNLQNQTLLESQVDESLEALSINSSTSKSDILGELYENSLRPVREEAKIKREEELRELNSLFCHLKGTLDRLKLLDSPKKVFEDASKTYYDGVLKYLSKIETDPTKLLTMDKKHLESHNKFETLRIEYYSMLESLIESEEVNISVWLKSFFLVNEVEVSSTAIDEMRRKSRHQQHSSIARTLSASITYKDGTTGEDIDSGEGSDLDDGASNSLSASDGSGFSKVGGIQTTRKRRSSIPSFSAESNPSSKVEPERKRDRLKIFLGYTPSTPSHSHSHSTDQPRSPTLSETPVSPSVPTIERSILPPLTPKQELASQSRKKEGFLWSSTKSISHTATGDGGQSYRKVWCVLSEGKLIEFSNWRTSLVVASPPLNLKFATARISRNTDRRFVFEIITQSSRRVYQALNDEDVTDWVTAINKSIESLLNGTSSVRHFDASRLTGSSTPFSLHDFGSTTSLVSRHHTSSSENSLHPLSHSTSPTSLASAASGLVNRLPSWMAPTTNHLSRRTSLSSGNSSNNRKNQKDKGASSLAPAIDFPSINPSPRRQTISTVSETYESQSQSRSGSSILDSALLNNQTDDSESISTSSASASASGSRLFENSQNAIFATTTSGKDMNLSEHDQRIEELVFNLAGTILTPEQVLDKKMKNAQRIHELAELDGNTTCCECENSDSNWSSWSLGIFLCIRCSGIHRSLGTHLSKVRSVELDDWNDEQLASMEKLGNVKAKLFWESRRPDGVVVNDLTVTEFIKNKYVERIWIPITTSTATASSSSVIPASPSSIPPEVPSKSNSYIG